jgi:hypothetical protein
MKSMIFLTILFLGIVVVSCAIGVRQIVEEHTFLAGAETATGTVTRSQVDSSGNAIEFCPVVEFTTRAGQPVAFENDICKSHPGEVQIGQKVQVYYDPQNPKNVQRKDANLLLQYGDMAGFPFLFGLLFLGITVLMDGMSWFAARRRHKKQAAGSGYMQQYINRANSDAVRLAQEQGRKAQAGELKPKLEEPRRPQGQVNPPDGESEASLLAQEERLKAQTERLKAQEAELQRKIEERRRQKGQ